MKKIFTFLMTMMLATVSIMAKTGLKPAGSSDAGNVAVPAFSEFVADGETIFYLYNVEAHAFVTGGNDWGTRASGNIEKGNQFKFTDNGGKYKMSDLVGSNWNALDCDGNKDSWVDGQGRAGDGEWVIAPLGNNTYSISNARAGELKWGIQLDMVNSRVQFKSNAAYGYTWAFVSVEDYEAYRAELDKEAVNALLAENTAVVNEALADEIKAANKVALDAMGAIVNGTNIYGEGFEAYAAKYNDYLAQYEAGTLTETVVNPSAATGWHSSTAFNFLLTPWISSDKACNNFDNNLYINTWSTEGIGDGSNFLVPFFEYWTGDEASLGANTIKTTVTGLIPGQEYTASVWARVRIKNNGGTDASGITFQVGEGEAVNICDGDAFGQMRVKQVTATGVADANGELVIAFNVAADNNVSWLSFKNVSYEITQPVDLTISPAFVVEGEEDVVTLNDHSSVSVPSANALKVNFGDNAAVRYATYVINELVEDVDWSGEPYTYEEEVASGTLSINTIGYAEFAEPLTFYYGHKYNIIIKAWDVDENNLFDEDFNMAAPIGTFTAEFNGSTDETPAGEDIVVTPAFINGEEEVTLNDHASVSVEAANAIKVAFENAQPTEVNYVINEMVQSESEEGTSWVAGEEIAAGTLSMNVIGYAEFANPLTFVSGKKYQLTVSAIAQTEELGSYTYEFNGAYVAPEGSELADGDYVIKNVAENRYLNGANSWGTKASTTLHGQFMTIAKLEDGTYTIDSHHSNGGDKHYLAAGDNTFIDALPVGHTIEAVAEGIFTIKDSNGKYLVANEGLVNFNADEATEAAQWQFISKEDILAQETPADFTALIKDANFNRNNTEQSAWDIVPSLGGPNYSKGENITAAGFVAEKWGGNSQEFTSAQTIEIPNGKYLLKVQGFYRYNNTTDNTNDVAATAHADGTEEINSYLFANDQEVALMSIADETAVAEYGKMPFSQAEAASAFVLGLYQNELEVEVTDGTLTLGVKKTAHPGCDWTVWDNFELYYLGAEAPEEQIIETALLDGEEEITLNTHSSVSAEKMNAIKANFIGMPNVLSATYAIMPMTLVQTEEGSSWTPDTENATTGNLSINAIGYAEVDYTFNQGTKYQIVVKATLQDGTDVTETYEINGAAEPAGPEIAGESLKLMPGGNSNLPIPEDAVRVFTFTNQWSSTAPTVNSFDASIYKEIVIEFKEALPFYYNTPHRLAGVEGDAGQKWGGVAAGETEYRLDLTETGSITDFSIQNTQASETPGNTFAIANAYAVKQDGSVEPLFFQTPSWNGGTMTVDADIYSANVTFNGQWANIGIDGLKDVEGKKIIRVYTNTPINPDDVQFCIRTTDGADAWPQILLQDDTKCYGLAEINETLESILLQWKSTTPGSMDIVAVTVELVQEQTIETALLNGEDEIAINTHSSVSVEQIDAIKVQFGIPTAVKSATYSIMPMSLVQNEEGSSWTPDTQNATSGEFSINTIGYAEVEYTFEKGTKYQIVVKVDFFDGTDATETYEVDGTYIVEPEIAIADMKFNVAEDADLDEDGDFKVEFNYAATANEAAEATFPSGMIAYKVTDAENNVVAEGETDFDLSLTSRNIYLKNLEAGQTYTLTATKVYGAGFDMTSFETVEIPATFAGELPTITFTVPEEGKVTYEGYISMVADFVDPNTVSKTVAQQETIVVSKSEIEFSSVVLPDVNIATGSFTVPVTTSTGNDGETVYTADGVDVDLNTLYISGGQDEVVTYKAWLLGVDSANGPVIYLHLESVNQEIFIAYNSALDITEFILANVSDVDVKTGNVKALKTLEAVNINSVKNNGIANGKYLENGKVVIVRNGQKYTTNGSITK